MATTKAANETLDMDDFESLLSALSAEELENINDHVDPEVFNCLFFVSLDCHVKFSHQNAYLPASDRCKSQTNKAPTGTYDRTKLLSFITEQGKNEKDWDEQKPYVPGEKKGKVWKAPDVIKPSGGEDQEFLASTEWDDVLTNASETEIVELAGLFF